MQRKLRIGRAAPEHSHSFTIGDIAADSNALLYALWRVPSAIKIVAARLGVKTLVTKADTNYNTVDLKNGSVVIASIANGPVSGGTTFAAGAFADMAIVPVTPALETSVAAGGVLTLKVTKTGNGLAFPGAVVQIEYDPS